MNVVSITAPGQPVPWQRARRKGKRYFTDPKVAEYQERVRSGWLVAGRPRFGDAPLEVVALFVIARAPSQLLKDGRPRKGAPAYPPRCDVDNLLKNPLDALQGEGMAFDDDQQVLRATVEKRYAVNGEEPHTLLELRPA